MAVGLTFKHLGLEGTQVCQRVTRGKQWHVAMRDLPQHSPTSSVAAGNARRDCTRQGRAIREFSLHKTRRARPKHSSKDNRVSCEQRTLVAAAGDKQCPGPTHGQSRRTIRCANAKIYNNRSQLGGITAIRSPKIRHLERKKSSNSNPGTTGTPGKTPRPPGPSLAATGSNLKFSEAPPGNMPKRPRCRG